MRKNFRMYLTLALVMLGVMSVNAQELVSLQDVPFTTWVGGNDGYGKDATAGEAADCAWVLNGEDDQLPYGDGNVINGADLSLYSKLIITYTAGTPRVLMNRDVVNGNWNADEAASQLIDNTQSGWSSKYFAVDGNTLTVDLKQILKDKGYVRLHAIKGASWAPVTVTSMMLERQGKAQQIGWTNLINNSDMEGDDVSSFFTKINQGAPEPSEIIDGVGKDGSRGIMVAATAKVAETYDNQFWFRFNEPVPAGTKYRVSFDYKADVDAATQTQAHAEPSDYIHWDMFGDINFTQNWQTFAKEGEVTAEQSTDAKQFLSVAFNLNAYEGANNYYFDNIKFEVYKYGTTAEYDMDVIKLDFGFDTNSADLVKATGKPRLVYPEGCATVKMNGEEMAILSVEAFADGRFFIFTEDILDEDAEVEVSFTNPTDPAYHLIYTSGSGGDVANVNVIATNNSDVPNEDGAYAYIFETPVIVKAEPEDGSFNLPNSISEFKITFDKNVDCAALVVTLGSEKLTVVPAEGFAEEVILKRAGGELATGEYVLILDKVYAEEHFSEEMFGTYKVTLNIGKVEFDPNDVPKEMLAETFNECEKDNIPAGYFVKFGEEDRPGGTSAGSGPRMFDFAAGGDFTKGLYFREGYVEYGSMEGYALTLEAGKKYQVHFNSAMWKDNGASMRFEIFNEAKEQVLAEMVSNTPNVNGGQGTVNGSTSTTINFIPEATGNYVVRWTSAGSLDGDAGYAEIILANPSVKYIPNATGVEETNALNTALADAKSTREANTDERYAGSAFNALDAAIKKYEAEMGGYTAPSKYWNAVEDLTALSDAMKTHRANCDNYDLNLSKAIDLVAQYGETKFKAAPAYTQLKEIAAKYEGKVLTDDKALEEALAELTQIVDLTSYIFTEGPSKRGEEGIKVLVERIRLGVEALKSLGVSEDDELIVRANNAVTDDDAVAEDIKSRLATIVYGNLKDPNNEMFKPVINEETLEETTPTYDMTAFVKNPNIYAINGWKQHIPEENVPGWSVPTGNCEVNSAWTGTQHQVEGLASDMAFTKYRQNMRIEQTISDLPAGVYTVIIDAVSWADDPTDDGYAFIKTSATPAPEEGGEEQFEQKIDLAYWGQYVGNHDNVFENVAVTDGILTLGVNFGPKSQYEFDQVKVYLAAPAAGFDYDSAFTGIESAEAQTVRALQLYDLNGSRITTARKGIVIVKKIMSDGSVRTEKVIKK